MPAERPLFATRSNVLNFLHELQLVEESKIHQLLIDRKFFPLESSLVRDDPYSEKYRDAQVAQYLEISGRAEYNPFIDEKDNVLEVKDEFTVYPFTTRDPICVGSYLVGVGLAMRATQLPPGSVIVEYGVGWGHTTLALAQLGYQVIAVDIEEKFLKLLQLRAARLGVNIITHHGEFGDLPSNVDEIDGALFYECFHHSLHHQKVVSTLFKRLKRGGRLILAGEPLFDEEWHYPWGLRLDGQSIWAIATHGWMELGFKRSYLEDLLRKNGFTLERHRHPEFGCVGEVYVGIKAK